MTVYAAIVTTSKNVSFFSNCQPYIISPSYVKVIHM